LAGQPQPAITVHRVFDPPLTNRLALDAALADLLARRLTLTLRLADDTQLAETLSFRQLTHTPARMALAAQGILARLLLTGGITEIRVTLAGLVAQQGEQPGLFGGVHRPGSCRLNSPICRPGLGRSASLWSS
jgi:hypothetical protein